jgi:UDP-N-acetylglucosamine--N-acetylmuramyl-(pentapeptide) pyrophosphoryl-undecaprenol N-acetylglucosamine transferase
MASAKLIREFRPDVMIGVGGYASGPAMLVAALMNIPTVAFEPNVVPGFANRLLAPTIRAAAVHFEQTCHYFRNCHVTGVPVRREFFTVPARPKDAPPTLLVFGGSQGAHAINRAVIDALPKLIAALPAIHIIHQTGEPDYLEAQDAYLSHDGFRRGLALHRRYARGLCPRRLADMPLGREHGCRSHRSWKAGHLYSPSHRSLRSSTA